MRYLSDGIRGVSGVAIMSKWSIRDVPGMCAVIVRDTDNNTEEKTRLCDLRGEKVLGFGISSWWSCGAAVVHTHKTAMLHKYIESASSVFRSPSQCVFEADVPVFSFKEMYAFTDEKEQDLFINVTCCAFDIFGPLGSGTIFARHDKETQRIATLYDFLGWVCRESRCNVMSYRDLVFYSETRGLIVTLRLAKTQEAMRFFTKMYMDVMR